MMRVAVLLGVLLAILAAGTAVHDRGSAVFTSRAAAESAMLAPAARSMRTLGFYRGGDGGGAIYARAPGATPTDRMRAALGRCGFRTGDGVWWLIPGPVVELRSCGAKGDGRTDDSPAIAAWLHIMGELTAARGDYLMASPVGVLLAADTRLTLAKDARFIAGPTVANILFYINGSKTPHQAAFAVSGGHFDVSAVPMGGNDDQGEVFEVVQARAARFSGVRFWAAASYSAGRGDTAIALTDTRDAEVSKSQFYGFADSCIYVSGGNSPTPGDEGGPTRITNDLFEGCSVGVTAKRAAEGITIADCIFRRNYIGVTTEPVGAGEIQPGRRLFIVRDLFIDSALHAINFRGGGDGSRISQVRIEDFGYDLKGRPDPNAVAIDLQGSSDVAVTDSWIGMKRRRSTASHVGIGFGSKRVGPVAYVARRNTVSGVTFSNLGYGLYEDVGVGPNRYDRNVYREVQTKLMRRGA